METDKKIPVFIKIQGDRIRISDIHRYSDSGENKISISAETKQGHIHNRVYSEVSQPEKSFILQTLDFYLL